MTGLDITTHPESTGSGVVRVCVIGEVDIATAPQISDAVQDAITGGAHEVLLDMAAVGFLDSTGIGALLRLRAEAAEHHATVRVIDAHPRVIRVLTLTGLLDVLTESQPGDPVADTGTEGH